MSGQKVDLFNSYAMGKAGKPRPSTIKQYYYQRGLPQQPLSAFGD